MGDSENKSSIMRRPPAMSARPNLENDALQMARDIESADLDRLLKGIPGDIARLLNGSEVRIFFKDLLTEELYCRFVENGKVREVRIPVDPSSASGCAALTRAKAFAWKTGPTLKKRYVTAVPMMALDDLIGVMELTLGEDGVAIDEPRLKAFASLSEVYLARYQALTKSAARSTPYDRLIRSGVLDPKALETARARALKEGRSVEHILIDEGIDRQQVGLSLAEHFECRFVSSFADRPIKEDLVKRFSLDYLKMYAVLPLARSGDVAEVAVANPRNLTLIDDISRHLGTPNLLLRVAIREDILEALEKIQEPVPGPAPAPPTPIPATIDVPKEAVTRRYNRAVALPKEEPPKDSGDYSTSSEVEDSEAVKLVNEVIQEAIEQNASDIHLEPTQGGGVVIRFRVDGICHDYRRVQEACARAVVSRVKIMAELDIAEHRLPQDGKIRMRDSRGRKVDLRVAVVPTQGSQEDVVLRILPDFKAVTLQDLNMGPQVLERFKKVIEQPHGIFLCAGPTGSGKTTTLHAALGHLKGPEVKIWTAEDPIEISQDGLRQVQVQPKIGLTFERCLRAFLRCDPDIIMIGEIRDRETADAAIEASLTGHMVLSTLHTNSAPETVTRLLDMGLDPYTFGDSILGVLAQRLVRRICDGCRDKYHPSADEFEELRGLYGDDDAFRAIVPHPENLGIFRGKGCTQCFGTGYHGRLGIHELLVATSEIRALVHKKADAESIRRLARQDGMRLLKQDGIRKVIAGETDLLEVMRNCIDQ